MEGKSVLERINEIQERSWKLMILPERMVYSDHDMGPQVQRFDKCTYRRVDYSVLNRQSLNLSCSFFQYVSHHDDR